MKLLNLIFDLGVLFAIYSFIWFFIDIGITLLFTGRVRTDEEIYLFRALKYLFLVNLIFLFSLSQNGTVELEQLFPSAAILMVYFIGKLQRKQKQQALFNQLGKFTFFRFNAKYEITLIILSIVMFVLLVLFPEYANNNIANWFEVNVRDLSNTVIIGFIFKVVGFFFLLNMLFKMFNTINYVLSGKPLIDFKTYIKSSNRNDDNEFDDFEEL